MKGLLLHAVAAAAIGLAGAADAAPLRAAAPAHVDWTRTVVATPLGGYRMGNPNARVKLVEYGSITCPHCAAFAREAGPALRASYVKSGRVSWEYRPFLIFPTDPGLFMLLRCQGAAAFFPTSDRLYADQRDWVQKVQDIPQERAKQIQALAPKARFAALVEASGTASYFHGLSAAQVKACLADQRNLNALLATTEKSGKDGVAGTPSFAINGNMIGTVDWAGLEPLLKGSGG